MLLHGIGHSRHAWEPVAELLARHHDVYLVDLPGHGDSALPAQRPLGVGELTDHVERFLHELGLDRPVVVGNSLGGAIALELARRGAAGAVVALAPIGFWSRLEVAYAVAMLRSSRTLVRLLGPVLPKLLACKPLRAVALGVYFARPGRLSLSYATATVRGFGDAPGVRAILPYSRRYLFRHGEGLHGVPSRSRGGIAIGCSSDGRPSVPRGCCPVPATSGWTDAGTCRCPMIRSGSPR